LLGGAATYAGLSAAFHKFEDVQSTPNIGIVSAVGQDFSTSDQLKLESAGLNLAGVVMRNGDTFRWSGMYQGSMENANTISTDVNVLENFNPEIPESWRIPEILFCANTHPATQVSVLDQCPSAVITALDSFMMWINEEKKTLSEALRKVDIAILNEEEVCAIANDEILPRAMSSLQSGSALYGGESAGPGPRCIVVKRGSSGVIAKFPFGLVALPAYPISNVVDPTGCGDSFAGAFLANISGRPGALNDVNIIRNALVHATVTASFTIGGLGCSNLSNIERGSYHARLDKYRRIVGL
ncbi:PfkB family carbohydrate kinase, partial [Euryarchaeota archaeon]|nr:PfkB family carbohydrate kinase [Euryarchaeota archaeon]